MRSNILDKFAEQYTIITTLLLDNKDTNVNNCAVLSWSHLFTLSSLPYSLLKLVPLALHSIYIEMDIFVLQFLIFGRKIDGDINLWLNALFFLL